MTTARSFSPLSPTPYRAVVFDMDGVLADSEPLYFEIERASFARHGITLGEAEQHAFVGVSLEEMWRTIKERYGLQPPLEELLAAHQRNVLEAVAAHTSLQPIPESAAFIRWLKRRGYRIAVASSSPIALIHLLLKQIGCLRDFDIIASGEEVKHSKPAPDVFLLAAERLGVPASECLAVEDSHNGVRAAKAAGMQVVGYRNPNSGNQDLTPADWIVTDYSRFMV
ncbi:HAD family hydrolase [Paenibacillus sp. MMS18-CY102]|uniref:HAD family hydrolase n=1 Tax=Paenibacillus sp. MMS18-CY102 TaxID=2682849 RepID=UPI001365487A|nr:HAD family phosphatase [Paenibacillus sp. MMS18-CY102]MWC26992.1 HAD-IA family hydrolase [Paenibacillus sp. MMS18-CY102]